MKVYITARALYAVETKDRTLVTFNTLINANSFIRSQNEVPVYTWFN
jgi:hypothetical protein